MNRGQFGARGRPRARRRAVVAQERLPTVDGSASGGDQLRQIYQLSDRLAHLYWGLTSADRVDPHEALLSGATGAKGGLRQRDESGQTRAARGWREKLDDDAEKPQLMSAQAKLDGKKEKIQMGAAPPSDRLITHDGGLSTWGNAAGSQGYGETTLMSTHKLIRLLGVLRSRVLATFDALRGSEIHPAYDLGRDSAFIDVGSGYGKVVFHAALVARCSRSVGVECVHSRHRIAAQTAASLPRTDPPPPAVNADAAAPAAAVEAGVPRGGGGGGLPAVFSGWASAVQLLWGDATQHLAANYTHVYVFDRVFAKHTMLALALQLQAAPFFVLASYRPPTEWSQYGLTKAAAVARS